MIRKEQVRWGSSDVRRKIQLINKLFDVDAYDGGRSYSTKSVSSCFSKLEHTFLKDERDPDRRAGPRG